jgi:hypothetical protein
MKDSSFRWLFSRLYKFTIISEVRTASIARAMSTFADGDVHDAGSADI